VNNITILQLQQRRDPLLKVSQVAFGLQQLLGHGIVTVGHRRRQISHFRPQIAQARLQACDHALEDRHGPMRFRRLGHNYLACRSRLGTGRGSGTRIGRVECHVPVEGGDRTGGVG